MQKIRNSYRGNSNLLPANAKMDYEDWQIEEVIKCQNSIEYFLSNYVKIVNIDDGLVKFNPYDYQKDIIKLYENENRICIKCPRQVGKSLIVSGLCLHEAIFNPHRTIAILGNKEKTSVQLLSVIKLMIEHLPIWLKCGIIEYNKKNVIFDNGSEIFSSSTSSSAIRGRSCSLLVLDEFAFISKNVFDEFFTSVYPTIASSKTAKVIIISTPFGLNHFYKMYTEAEQGLNGYVPFTIEWNDVPGRDEEFKEKTIAEIGIQRWKQEYEASFVGSSATLIDGNTLKTLVFKKPIQELEDSKFKIYDLPIKNDKYVLVCDVCEGIGKDYSTIQVINITALPYKQVAVYRDNEIKPFSYHLIINKIGKYYNNGLVVIERNNCGAEVIDNLYYESDYENCFYGDEFGFRTTAKTKRTGCSNLKFLIENDSLLINDYETINELSRFVYDGKTFKAQDYDGHDDLVMPLVIFAYLILDKTLSELWFETCLTEKVNKDKEEELEEFFVLIGNDIE